MTMRFLEMVDPYCMISVPLRVRDFRGVYTLVWATRRGSLRWGYTCPFCQRSLGDLISWYVDPSRGPVANVYQLATTVLREHVQGCGCTPEDSFWWDVNIGGNSHQRRVSRRKNRRALMALHRFAWGEA